MPGESGIECGIRFLLQYEIDDAISSYYCAKIYLLATLMISGRRVFDGILIQREALSVGGTTCLLRIISLLVK